MADASEIGLAPPKPSRRPSRTRKAPERRWSTWASLPLAALMVAVGGIGARLSIDHVDSGCPTGATHGVGSPMIGIAVLLLAPTSFVMAVVALRRGPASARIAALVGVAVVVVMGGYLYSLAYHWDIQCSVH